MSNISEKVALLLPLTAAVDAVLKIKVTVDAIEKLVQLLSDTYDEFVERLDTQDKAIANLEEGLENVGEANSAHEIKRLKHQLNELELYGRRLNLEVDGILVKANDDVLALVNEIGVSLQLDKITESEIEGIHRLPARADKVPPIIARFTRKATKDQ